LKTVLRSNSSSLDSGYTNLQRGLFLEHRSLEVGISGRGRVEIGSSRFRFK
jgi:hypothetical protein